MCPARIPSRRTPTDHGQARGRRTAGTRTIQSCFTHPSRPNRQNTARLGARNKINETAARIRKQLRTASAAATAAAAAAAASTVYNSVPSIRHGDHNAAEPAELSRPTALSRRLATSHATYALRTSAPAPVKSPPPTRGLDAIQHGTATFTDRSQLAYVPYTVSYTHLTLPTKRIV